MYYYYGMRLRGFSPGCQPKEGLVRRIDSTSKKYYDILIYDRELTKKEETNYELDYIYLCAENEVISFEEALKECGTMIGNQFLQNFYQRMLIWLISMYMCFL